MVFWWWRYPFNSGGLLTLNTYLLLKYLARGAFGSEGWIISCNNLEYLIGSYYWFRIYMDGEALFILH